MNVFVARQPIFDKKQKVVAYELLFRSNQNNIYSGTDADQATKDVIANSFLLIGMNNLTGGKKAFINFTDSLLKSDIVETLPKELVVVEILEDIKIDEEVVEICKRLKAQGYILALDDFVFEPSYEPLLELVDIIKVDFMITKGIERRDLVKKFKAKKIRFLAEKVETIEEYKEAVAYGYSYFQGYFFSKPVILSATELPSYKHSHMALIKEISKHEVDFRYLENIIKKDISLSYKLLKYINSASFGFRKKLDSILSALLLLGKEELAKWIYLIALRELGENKPSEIMTSSVIRAKFSEMLAPKLGLGHRASDMFFMGLLSQINAITNLTMENAIAEIPIAEDIKEALLGADNQFRDVLELIISYEIGEWEKFSAYAKKLNFEESEAPGLYMKSLEWVSEFMQF
jgi:c-di-GMP-related signal transduction protein